MPTEPHVHGVSTVSPVKKRGVPWWLWLLLLLAVVAIILLAKSCKHDEPARTVPVSAPGTPPVAVKKVTLPGGASLDLDPSSLSYLLQEYLASSAPAPRTFTFENLNFATASADLPADAQNTVDALAQILKAYPNAKIRLDGYADARGSAAMNDQLGAQRANAVSAALQKAGVAADRIATATGGESNPVETNATAQGRAENRRTELVVTAK